MSFINPIYTQDFRGVGSPQAPIMDKRLARAYIIDQPFIGLLPLEEALKKGTIFPNLVMPEPHEFEF
jgi:hypothetical protein